MNTAGNLFWTNVTEILKENNKSLKSVALYMRDGINDKKTLALYDKLYSASARKSIRQMF